MMKKKVFCLLLALMALFVTAACAETYTCKGLFGVEYDSSYDVDTTSYLDDNDDTYTWLFWLENDTNAIDCGVYDWTEYYGSDENLYDFSASELEDYISSALEEYEAYDAQYVKTITVNNDGLSIPFPVFKINYQDDEDDVSTYQAETVIGGKCIYFEAYEADASGMAALEKIVGTFRLSAASPVTLPSYVQSSSNVAAQTYVSNHTYTAQGYYSVTFSSDYTIDTKAYADDSDDTYQWLCWAENDDYAIDCGLYDWTEGYEGFSLFAATDQEIKDYISESLEDYSDYNPEYITTYNVDYKGSKIPFIIFKMEYEDNGETYMTYEAETIANGYGIYFEIYEADNGALTELEKLLDTFVPAV